MKGYKKRLEQLRRAKALERQTLDLRKQIKVLAVDEARWARVLAFQGPDAALTLGPCPVSLEHLLLHARSLTVKDVAVVDPQ